MALFGPQAIVDVSAYCAQEQTPAIACTNAVIMISYDLCASIASQMRDVRDRLPVSVVHAAWARYGFIEPWPRQGLRKSGFLIAIGAAESAYSQTAEISSGLI
jgi:hypothetical protein